MIVFLDWHLGVWIGMIIGLDVDFCASLYWMGILFLISVCFLVFWTKWPKVLVTETSGQVGCLCWGFWSLGALDKV